MKRLGSSDSLGGFISICHNSTGDQHNEENSAVYSREFQSMMEGLDEQEGGVEEYSGHMKKRRLSIDQVKALEKNFEVDNKLEPDRKVKLAQELGLQPRQVAVWFQNRRARWKTKQLERDYGILKANYDALKLNYDQLHKENESLLQEIGELKSALQDDKGDESKVSIKEEKMGSENEDKAMDDHHHDTNFSSKASMDDVILEYENDDNTTTDHHLHIQSFNNNNSNNGVMGPTLFTDQFKDGSSDDSDSSAILNEDTNNNGGFRFPITKDSTFRETQMEYHPQFVKIEEHNFFGGEDSCSTFFSDDQPPSLQWDCPDQWN